MTLLVGCDRFGKRVRRHPVLGFYEKETREWTPEMKIGEEEILMVIFTTPIREVSLYETFSSVSDEASSLVGEMADVHRMILQVYYEAKEPKGKRSHFGAAQVLSGRDERSEWRVFRCFPTNREEEKHQELVSNIYILGEDRIDRTTVGTRSLFGYHLSFDLSTGKLPIGTLRKAFLKGIFEELLWFLRGQTDSRVLESKGVNVWKLNSSREALDKLGLTHLREGDCGPVYGFQWRHWGAKYRGCEADYTGEGTDQVARLVEQLRNDPASRRMVLSGWNVGDLREMCLPPCHSFYQFHVSTTRMLDCHFYQRSSDVVLAGMWNITSASLLVMMLAQVCGLRPGRLYVSYGDVHLYSNHLEKIPEYLTRVPLPFPRVSLKPRERLTEYEYTDLTVQDYLHYPEIKFPMNA
jgi:thymidylate synthase